MSRVVVLDCEAVHALASSTHPHHRRVVAHMQVVADRKRKARRILAVVPTAVRVEANLDRAAPRARFFNSLRIGDLPLDGPTANIAAELHRRHTVSVPDAHVGAAVASFNVDDDITVITSDPQDMRRVADDTKITIIKL